MYRQLLRQQPSVTRIVQRSLVTSAEKRALSKGQLKGVETPKAAVKAPPPPPAASTPPPPPADDGMGMMPIIGVVAVAALGGAAYSMDLFSSSETPAEPAKSLPKKASTTKGKSKGEDKSASKSAAAATADGNRVLNIALPDGKKRSSPPKANTDHPKGNKVAMKPASDGAAAASPEQALKELQAQLAKETDQVLEEAHRELAKLSSLDMSELDTMTPVQLKIRLVQMAKDLEERTKWEAVRLKEFLAMKEKEVENKYLTLMKNQRLEVQSSMEHKFRDQQLEMESSMKRTIMEKEQAIDGVIEQSLALQEQHYNDQKAGFEKQTEEAISAKYEELFGNSLAEAKQEFAQRMEQKAQQMEALTKKLSELDLALQSTKDFETGSVQAHRMSAAAIALIDKLESTQPAGAAMDALKSVADTNAVVSSALDALPKAVSTSGVASVQELQARFEERVLPRARQAALVPSGQAGLEGQLMGMVFSTLKFAPSAEDAAPESEKDASEYLLARARRFVQLGELEQAVGQMEKLQGQSAFTTKDWVKSAKERVAVEKALKVIRLECALANESMGNGPGVKT